MLVLRTMYCCWDPFSTVPLPQTGALVVDMHGDPGVVQHIAIGVMQPSYNNDVITGR